LTGGQVWPQIDFSISFIFASDCGCGYLPQGSCLNQNLVSLIRTGYERTAFGQHHGTLVSTIELDPFGGDTDRSINTAFQPRHFTTYERDTVGGMDEATARRYHGWWSRFSQPDPYDGGYSLTDPQSFNRYSYVQSDPVNFVDPSGLDGECIDVDGNIVAQISSTTESSRIFGIAIGGDPCGICIGEAAIFH